MAETLTWTRLSGNALADLLLDTSSVTPFSTIPTGGETSGWAFTVSSPLNVAALGIFDLDGDVLTETHQVGLWNSDGTCIIHTKAHVERGRSRNLIACRPWTGHRATICSRSWIPLRYPPCKLLSDLSQPCIGFYARQNANSGARRLLRA